MAEFTTYSIETAPAGSQSILAKAKSKYGYVPNLLGNMAESPALLEAYVTLAGIMNKTCLNEEERQVIMLTNSRLNECGYCMAAHTSVSQMADVPTDVIEALRTDRPINDVRLEALRTFSVAIHQTRGNPTEEQINAFLSVGYTKETILEIVLGTAFKVISNYTDHLTSIEIDKAYAVNAWSIAQTQVA
ncbi:Alkylhydroperoxidase AhpD family core domain protein [Candidatus Terasakiella magnetica]|uniref:Alkylhydroperoxidase AhpD family core domain protein n=1 Tax=Candidatus Terasakiella magnetica TaxID=1867952 RepID=A0A1C3RH49_9PROT|nr:carboxymuconolactone decarboxylase family protein [Candidatus Terasakiella magnetica]SCA56532.1 Alkylhydroperoxidase AhpD family core domain protein [Candidatus Terasakiella magnetica]